MKCLSSLTCVQLMFLGLTCWVIQRFWAALLVLSVSLLLGCMDSLELKYLIDYLSSVVSEGLTVFSLKTA